VNNGEFLGTPSNSTGRNPSPPLPVDQDKNAGPIQEDNFL
jgi:hypothetical protein